MTNDELLMTFGLSFAISDLIDRTMNVYDYSYDEAVDILAAAFDSLKTVRINDIIAEEVDKAIDKVTNKDS